MTPTKIASLALLLAGFAALLGLRVVDGIDQGVAIGVGLILIGLSCLVDALLPGGSELTPEQEVMLLQAGIRIDTRTVRAVSVVVGLVLMLAGLYLAG